MRVGITGGIGSGKSTVCRLFEARGVAVYYSDVEAKRIMNESLRDQIISRFGEAAYRGGKLDREYLGNTVFGDKKELSDLNAIVHPAVMADFEQWSLRQMGDYVIIESAILFEATLDKCVDLTLAVLAPHDLRIERTCRRDGATEDAVRQRIAAQISDDELNRRANYTLVNIFEEDLEPNVVKLDMIFRYESKKY